jgi:two-component system, OmpR family, response regulator
MLVVEDDAALATMYRTALRLAGFDVHAASDGVSALRMLEGIAPDLIGAAA